MCDNDAKQPLTVHFGTSEHYSMFFVEEEGTGISFRRVREVIAAGQV